MEHIPPITIVTPFYNTSPDIFAETVQSILDQSFCDWIWLIVNDGSNDIAAIGYLKELVRLDPRISVITHGENKGLSTARNTGIAACRSPFVFLIDSDDTIAVTALEKFYWFLESNNNFQFVNSYTVGFGAKNYLWQDGFDKGDVFLQRNPVIPTALFKTTLFGEIGGYDESMREGLEDWDFWLKCASKGKWGYTIPEYLTRYRNRENHEDKWKNWNNQGLSAFRNKSRIKYPGLNKTTFPRLKRHRYKINEKIPFDIKNYSVQTTTKPSILFIIPWMTIGGADQFNINIISKLVADFNIVIVCTLSANHLWQDQFEHYVKDIFILPNFLHARSYCSFISTIINSRRIGSIFLSNSALGYMMLPYIQSRHPAIKIIDYCHIEESWREGGYPTYSINYGAHIHRQFVSSEYLKYWMINRGANVAKIKTLYIGIDSEKYAPDSARKQEWRQDHKIKEQFTLIVFAGRLSSQKQPDVLINTAKELSEISSDFLLIIIGDGPDQQVITHGIKKHHLESCVWYLGARSNDEVKEWLNAAEIFFLPSSHEGIALSIFEAMSLSCATVGADVGGQSELVDEKSGVLISIQDKNDQVSHYVESLKSMIENRSGTLEMGLKARDKIENHFSLNFTFGRLKNELSDISGMTRNQDTIEYMAQGRLGIEGYCNMTELSKTSILDYSRVNIFNKARSRVMLNNGAYSLLGSFLKKIYNFGLNHNLIIIPKLIKKTGKYMTLAGRHLMNIDD